MDRKDYIKEKLSKEEKAYLKRIILTARNSYFEKNRKINDFNVPLNEKVLQESCNIIEDILDICMQERELAQEFEKTLSNPLLSKYVKMLSLKEKEVLFYIFWKKMKIKEISKKMKLNKSTVEKIKNRALNKIAEGMLSGGYKNV